MLCDDCQQEHYDWIQQRPPKRRPEVWGNPALTLMNMRNHAEDWRKTVKYHTQLIRNHCEENHQNFYDQGEADDTHDRAEARSSPEASSRS